ncbi:DBH-like monooxygenase protein 1 [Portunus trituberculatus]|uniref:DBH-like monooxygenase protein 1 n=1 Tax=Portunus trituberculatus TaxID=210409 RepID=A0A5B7FKW4_PORTR|nr:DBH-like monooxygenase protein 1 [Portunus trituberculatus]
MQNFGTDASHTARNDSKIAGQAIFLAIASMGNVSPSIAPGVNKPIATKVSPSLVGCVCRLQCETALRHPTLESRADFGCYGQVHTERDARKITCMLGDLRIGACGVAGMCPKVLHPEVVWEIHARTRGWLGFGFSSNGGMDGADIVTAWVEDGKLHLQDRHGVGPEMPPEDEISDWRPLYARENDTHTMLVVARDVNTCDLNDYVLSNETVRLIYAWGEEDPSGDHPPYHGPRRGNR